MTTSKAASIFLLTILFTFVVANTAAFIFCIIHAMYYSAIFNAVAVLFQIANGYNFVKVVKRYGW